MGKLISDTDRRVAEDHFGSAGGNLNLSVQEASVGRLEQHEYFIKNGRKTTPMAILMFLITRYEYDIRFIGSVL